MIYWEDIHSDARYHSPFCDEDDQVHYMTFELDNAGFNNIRMGVETIVALAVATGRTLVLPAAEELCHLRSHIGLDGSVQTSAFFFQDFFHLDSISNEYPCFNVITMEEFLTKEALTGNLKNEQGRVVLPPHGRTKWDGACCNAAILQQKSRMYYRMG
jgi:hypothetical protein